MALTSIRLGDKFSSFSKAEAKVTEFLKVNCTQLWITDGQK